MVILNFYGKIEPICISQKLGLYLSNLPNGEENNWRDMLVDDIDMAVKEIQEHQKSFGTKDINQIQHLYSQLYPNETTPCVFDKSTIGKIADKMICIYHQYSYEDMPMGGWDTNPFDGRLCEEEYSEKIIDFINYLSYTVYERYPLPMPIPQWIYSSNHFDINPYRIFWGGESADPYIDALKQWGSILDAFLQERNDYLLFDYLANSIHKDNEYNENHLMKDYSLCQLFLEKKRESELDTKLLQFLDPNDSEQVRFRQAELFRQMRNKIAHGDFIAFEEKIEEYAVEFMDGKFNFDYSEYSRKNWAIQDVCCILDNIIRQLICLLLFDRDSLDNLKNQV